MLNRREVPRKAMRTQIFIKGLLGNLKQVCGAQLSYSYLARQVKHRAAFPRMFSFRASLRVCVATGGRSFSSDIKRAVCVPDVFAGTSRIRAALSGCVIPSGAT